MASGGGDNNNNNTKLYKGVRLRKWGKWVSEIRLPNSRERIWLGSYDSPVKAARAFDAALYCLRGRHATFNFPDTPCKLEKKNNVHQSLTHQEIQEVAAKFANEFDDNNCQEAHHQEGASEEETKSHIGSEGNFAVTSSSINNGSSSSSMCDVDQGIMDWTFLDMLDHSDYGLYNSELDIMHSGELLFSSPSGDPFDQTFEGDDVPFSHQSSLWNWNF